MPAAPKDTPGTDLLDEIAAGYRGAQVLLTANRLGVFATLGRGEKEAGEIARDLGADPRGTRILCDALAALGILEKEGGTYRNGPLVREHLLPDSPRPQRAILLHAAALYERWARLDDAVLAGRPVPDDALDPRLRGAKADFARAMADVARQSAGITADALDLRGVQRLLDVGGGPGFYALEFARREPGLQAVVLDHPETLEVARENLRQAGLARRVSLLAGDAFTADLGGPYDLVFASNFIHIYSAEENRQLVGRWAEALAPGGRVAIKDFLLDPGRTSPPGAAIFAVNMLVSTEGGDCYTVREVEAWLAGAGLEPGALTELTPHSRLLVGRKSPRG